MIHYEMGKHVDGVTFGMEISYWWEEQALPFIDVPAGLDVGVEFTHTKVRVYSEAQSGFLIGGSMGPFLEVPYAGAAIAEGGSGMVFGVQGSVWAWLILGGDFRCRWSGREGLVFGPGIFAKAAGCPGGCNFF